MNSLSTIFFSLFLTFGWITNLSAQIKMDFSAQFFPQQINKIYLHTNAPIRYITTDSEVITLEINVSTNTRKNNVVDHLVEKGRYDVVAKPVGRIMNLSMPNLDKVIRINQKEFTETITYTIYVPRGTKVGQYKIKQSTWEGSPVLAAR